MLTAKERDQRSASIRRHVLLWAKRGDPRELDMALAELKIAMNLSGTAPAPLGDVTQGVIPDLTEAEADAFIAAIEEGRHGQSGHLRAD